MPYADPLTDDELAAALDFAGRAEVQHRAVDPEQHVGRACEVGRDLQRVRRARRFDQMYCNVDPNTEDKDYVTAGGVFPVIQPKLGRVKRLVGTGAPSTETGQLLKMSKSLNNAIFLSDDADTATAVCDGEWVGRAVILDHGLGLFTLYGHLSRESLDGLVIGDTISPRR